MVLGLEMEEMTDMTSSFFLYSWSKIEIWKELGNVKQKASILGWEP